MAIPTPVSYTHIGRRAYTGHYAVTADAHRTPGRTHALNAIPGTRNYRALCGTIVAEWSDDHHLQDERQVEPAGPGHRVTCKRCRKIAAGAASAVDTTDTTATTGAAK